MHCGWLHTPYSTGIHSWIACVRVQMLSHACGWLHTPYSTSIHSWIACVHVQMQRRAQLFVTPWTVTHQAPLSMGFPRQEYWSGLWFTSPGDLPYSGMEPTVSCISCRFLTTKSPGKPLWIWVTHQFNGCS